MHTDNNLELNLLNIIFTYPEKQAFIFDNCNDNFFLDKTNREIFITAKELFTNGQEIDNVVVFEANKKSEIGKRLTEVLTQTLAFSAFTRKYCRLLFESYLERLIQAANCNADFEYIESLKLKYEFRETNIKHISDETDDFEERYHKKMETMLITGYEEIDNNVGSFMGGDYIALGGSTGTGKTTIALNIARQFCMQEKKVLYCSLEMPLEQLQNRFVCINQELNALKYRSCGFDIEEYTKYKEGLRELQQWGLYVLTDYNLTVEKLKIYALQQQKTGLDFIIIDYLGLMSGYGNKSLYEKSTIMSRKIKILATELNTPILVLVQLNRDLKNRQDKRPILSDIRESGAIEQDADFVMFAHRPALYQEYGNERELELIIAKNRHGVSNAICQLDFNLQTQTIKSKKWGNYA
jgi:replicative DNA helicase